MPRRSQHFTMASTDSEGSYSIWVMPKGPLAVQLKQQITEVREEFKGPQFEPHVTLLGGIRQSQAQVLKTAKLLAASLTPYELVFTDVHYAHTFHQCVFIRIKPQPEVVEAAARSRAAFGGDRDAPYMPHVSLLYAHIEEDRRQELVQRLHSRLLLSSESPLTEDGFIADELHVWYTEEADKSLESWRCVATFPFSGVDPFETSKEPFQED